MNATSWSETKFVIPLWFIALCSMISICISQITFFSTQQSTHPPKPPKPTHSHSVIEGGTEKLEGIRSRKYGSCDNLLSTEDLCAIRAEFKLGEPVRHSPSRKNVNCSKVCLPILCLLPVWSKQFIVGPDWFSTKKKSVAKSRQS